MHIPDLNQRGSTVLKFKVMLSTGNTAAPRNGVCALLRKGISVGPHQVLQASEQPFPLYYDGSSWKRKQTRCMATRKVVTQLACLVQITGTNKIPKPGTPKFAHQRGRAKIHKQRYHSRDTWCRHIESLVKAWECPSLSFPFPNSEQTSNLTTCNHGRQMAICGVLAHHSFFFSPAFRSILRPRL